MTQDEYKKLEQAYVYSEMKKENFEASGMAHNMSYCTKKAKEFKELAKEAGIKIDEVV